MISDDAQGLSFEQWLIHLGKSQNTATKYRRAIERSLSLWAQEAELSDGYLQDIRCYHQFESQANQIRELDRFQEYNTRGHGMYGAALNQYRNYLAETSGQIIAEDIEQVMKRPDSTPTQKSALINARVGQGKFREKLVSYWRGCAVTRYAQLRFLVASHIKPWRDSTDKERLDSDNGLLLLPNLDKVFDLGFITFEECGDICISEQLENYSVLGIKKSMSVSLDEQHQEYMAYHREMIFERM